MNEAVHPTHGVALVCVIFVLFINIVAVIAIAIAIQIAVNSLARWPKRIGLETEPTAVDDNLGVEVGKGVDDALQRVVVSCLLLVDSCSRDETITSKNLLCWKCTHRKPSSVHQVVTCFLRPSNGGVGKLT